MISVIRDWAHVHLCIETPFQVQELMSTECSCGIFFYYYCIYGRKGCFQGMLSIPFSSHLNNTVIFREAITFKYWFSFGNQSLFPWLLCSLSFGRWEFLFHQHCQKQGNWIQIFTAKEPSHSTSYCLHDCESSGMSFVNKVLCPDCWLCLCGCGCAPEMWNEM